MQLNRTDGERLRLEHELLRLLPRVAGVAKVSVRCSLQILRLLEIEFTDYHIARQRMIIKEGETHR